MQEPAIASGHQPAQWLRALGVERVYVLSCDEERLAAFLVRYVGEGWPLGGFRTWQQQQDPDGARGCRHGHLGILTEAVEDGLTGVMVLEDDVLFEHELRRRLEPELRWLHDVHGRGSLQPWGGLWLGGMVPEHRGAYDLMRETASLIKAPWPVYTTHAYILTGDAIETAARALAVEGVTADYAIQEALKGTVYCFVPAIAGQTRGVSHVQGIYREERW
jgi:hypothetical protein